jgi:Cu(I)/Ag(I) efflux system membrane fusion protein
MCKERIEAAAKTVAGVTKAEWSAETQQLHLSFLSTKTTVDQVAKAIVAVGHDTEKFKTTDSVYNTLPECCLYNRLK